NSGDYFTLTIARTSGELTPQIRVLSPNGDVVTTSYTGFAATEVVVQDAPMSGTYRVIVGDYQTNQSGEYLLRLAQAPEEFVVPSGDEGGSLTKGNNHLGNIPLADLDQWTFTADAGVFIHISIARASDNDLTPLIRLISPTGERVGFAYTGFASTELVVQDAPESGTYRVIVSDYQVNQTGDYVLIATW
ncbi:MAG TPA: hypothetical protein VFM60_02280, partial [Salinimicrobium sp.]|nr:hypothetical protein [Salinimicrobium sp.]